ncbi:MAG: cytochrome c oxidase assembly protein [Acidovorax sp.]|jgi:cytochrome c oxidase assembly protein subunit 11|nr:cytochrome c oxidase assembly protein [Acidovorax sp.]MDR3005078.1 cytochrome c oxidase assembly protein [Acidovorax sp.]
MALHRDNLRMVGKLAVVAVGMFAFGYALIPIYKHVCEALGINVLAISERQVPGNAVGSPLNTQVDKSRTITVEFDANARGPWDFKPERRSLQVHPGELATVMYEFQNVQDRRMAAQAIPSYAPRNAAPHFNKLECFCFNQYELAPGEKKEWPVAFVIDPRLPKDVTTITLSYTFFEVGGAMPAAPGTTAAPVAHVAVEKGQS